jgi:Glucose-6-phosphate dehydrogenase, C-terminal domain/Tetratricopeptide repeat
MEPPVRTDSEAIRDEKVKVLKAVPPLDPRDLVRGQFRGYRKEPGVTAASTVETFVALRLEVDSWRWQGVPFHIRAGKCLPVTCTEVVVRLRQPPTMFHGLDLKANYCRLRISPVTFALGANIIAPGEETVSALAEMVGTRHPRADEMDAYERLLGDAMEGDATLFAREDYAEEAWHIVDPVLRAGTPVSEYQPGTWGPVEAEQIAPPGDTIRVSIDLRLDLQSGYLLLGELLAMLDSLREVEDFAMTLDDDRRIARVWAHMAACFWYTGQLESAVDYSQRALAIATAFGDRSLDVLASVRLGLRYVYMGEYPRAIEVINRYTEALTGDLASERFEMPALPAGERSPTPGFEFLEPR